MKQMNRVFLWAPAAALLASQAMAQFTTPTVNGTIGASEYGTHTNGQNQELANGGAVTWYMTWDNSFLYVATSNANISEGSIIYLDTNPIAPVNGGSNSDGNTLGNNYDRTQVGTPFRADFLLYFKSGYSDYRTSNGSGGWNTQVANTSNVSASGSVKEVKVPWSAVPGGVRPASFNWQGMCSYDTGAANNGVYACVPNANSGHAPNVAGPTTLYQRRYYTVSSTADTTSTKPFSQISYSFVNNVDQTNFGATDVFDFTMNASGRSWTRANTGVINVAHDMNVGAGTLDFGASTSAFNVTGNVNLSGGTLKLSTASGGNLNVSGNFNQTSGTFTPQSGVLNLTGTTASTLSAGSYGALTLGNSGGVTLGGNVSVSGALSLTTKVSANGNKLTHTGSSVTGSSTGYLITDGGGSLERPSLGATPYTFHIGPSSSSYNPVTITNNGTTDTIAASVVTGLSQGGAIDASKIVNRTWTLTPTSGSGLNLDLGFQWAAADAGGSISTTNAHGWRWNGSTWVDQGGSTSGSGPYTTSVTGVTTLSPWTVGDALSLPVELDSFSIE